MKTGLPGLTGWRASPAADSSLHPVSPVHPVSTKPQVAPEFDALERLQAETATELDALLPAILDRAFKAER